MNCIHCNSEKVNKNGNKYNKQRYICLNCKKSFSLSDSRVKRSNKQRELALLLYSNNMSIRSIQKTINLYFDTKIAYSVVDNWLKTNANQLRNEIENKENKENKENNKPKTIEIIELDELYTYFYDIKKNKENIVKYGLLLIDNTIKLLHIK